MRQEDKDALLLACRQGRRWNGQGQHIPAELIRAILLGQLGGPPAGVRIEKGVVVGALKLSDYPLGHDRMLPALRLRGMTINEPIHLDNCRIARLELTDCRITRLQARDAEFGGAIDLRGVTTSGHRASHVIIRRPGEHWDVALHECSIDLANSKIEGDVRLNNARLCVGIPHSDERSIGPKPYALNLRAADVAGALRMEPNFVAVGGVTVADARIRGDVRAHGATLTARYGAAFRGQNAHINGTLFCSSLKQSPDNGVKHEVFRLASRDEGGIIFQNAEIGRVELNGCQIIQTPSDPALNSAPAIDLSYARIRGSIVGDPVLLAAGLTPTRIRGQVALVGAAIGGDIVLNGAAIDDSAPVSRQPVQDEGPTDQVGPVGAATGGDSLQNDVAIDDSSPPPVLPAADGGQSGPARYALTLRGASLNGTIRISGGFTARGGVCVADATIGGDIYVSDALLTAPPGGDALRGRNATIAGVLRGGCGRYASPAFKPLKTLGGIAFPNASMDLVDLSGARVETEMQGEPGRARARVDFESAHVRSGFFLCSAPARNDAGQAMQGVDPRVAGPVILTDAVIEGDLDLHGLEIDLRQIPVSPASLPAVVASGVKVGGSVAMASRSPTGGRDGDQSATFRIVAPPPDGENDVARVVLTTAKIGQCLSLAADSVRVISGSNIAVQGEVDVQGQAGTARHAPAEGGESVALDFAGGVMGSSFSLSGLTLRSMNAQRLRVGGDLRMEMVRIGGLCQYDRAQVGGHLDLTEIVFAPDPVPGKTSGLEPYYQSGRLSAPALYFDGAKVAGALRVRRILSRTGARKDREKLTTARLGKGAGDPDPSPHVSLLFTSVGQLDDVAATGWDRELCLRLKGFTYDAIYFNNRGLARLGRQARDRLEPDLKSDQGPAIAVASTTLVLSAVMSVLALVFGAPAVREAAAAIPWAGPGLSAAYTPSWMGGLALVLAWATFLLMVCNRGPRAPKAGSRIDWLEQQFRSDDDELHRDYHPQPYIQLARTYRLQGLFEFSDAVLERRVSREVEVKRQRLKAGARRQKFRQQNATTPRPRIPWLRHVQGGVYGFVWAAAAGLYRVFFGYGLKPHLAVVTFVLFWLTGAVMVDVASLLDLLAPDSPCGASVSNLVFALDAFVPLLDLGFADKCTISMSAPAGADGWASVLFAVGHVAMTGFTVVGWIVTSLTILTLTGVLRRFAEN